MRGFRSTWMAAILALSCGAVFVMMGSNAEAQKYGDDLSNPIPIRVARDSLEPLTFSNLIVQPTGRLDISVATSDFAVAIIRTLQQYGYNTVGAENLVFGIDNSSKARMILGGTLREIKCQGFSGSNKVTCDCAVDWEVYDTVRKTIVYKVLTRFRNKWPKSAKLEGDEAHSMVLGSLASLMSRQKFVDILQKKNDTLEINRSERAQYRSCEGGPLALPADLEEAKKSVVVVGAGGGATGAGFYFSPDGLILTAAHVVDGLSSVMVKEYSGSLMLAEVLRSDAAMDVAVLRTDTASSSCLRISAGVPSVGADVYVIGTPTGEDLAFSVSKGIISGTRDRDGQKLIQTDASISPGNSGGPMISSGGEVIGITVEKAIGYGIEGVGFGVLPMLALGKLNIGPGSTTEIGKGMMNQGSAAQWGAMATAPILDTPDPEMTDPYQLHIEQKDREEKSTRFTKLYGGWATACMISGITFGLVGAAILLDPDLNVSSRAVGWVAAAMGVGSLSVSVYLFVKRSQEKKRVEKERVDRLVLGLSPLEGGGAGQLVLRF